MDESVSGSNIDKRKKFHFLGIIINLFQAPINSYKFNL